MPEDMSPVEIACDRNFKRESNILHRQSLCRPPRKQLIPVKMPSKYYMPGVYHRPNMYEVERCVGVCQHPNHKCLPIEKEIIEVPITSDFIYSRLLGSGSHTSGNPPEKCMRIKMEKHLLCGCQCAMTQKNCSDKQVFSEDRCICECKDMSKAKSCSQLNRMWSNEKCDCICPPTISRQCSSAAVFDETNCRCIQN
ncbi:balbiani ring protein 3-like [Oppia nitens]|uniref:balbiani ring protein 3-like n=1 Tax=Oppia nitens TaxID=1686743 RepID=UPI0023DC7AC4|nr:balbiani ring protein 3-like [Oppia nitens]